MTYTRVFGHLGKADAHIAGGKGASLGEMTQAGIPVPPGFVVLASTFDRFLAKTDLTQEIDAILHTVKHDEMHTVEHASEKIQGLILAAQMPDDIATEILAEHEKLGAEFVAPQGHFQFSNAEYREENLVAVRSSATAEDGAEHAWAGQLDTHLNTPREEVVRNVQRCWASLFTPRAIFYRFEKGLHGTSISVAVVVQKMVQSELSGIAFSVHPVTEDRNQLIIEAGFGLGEAIVSGQVTPDSYVVEKNPRKIIDVNVSGQSKALYRKEGGGNEWQDLGEKGKTQVLTEAQILELSELIIRIENHYGFPCDIEWAYADSPDGNGGEGGKFYITQSRPITTLSVPPIKSALSLPFFVEYFRIDAPLALAEFVSRGESIKEVPWSTEPFMQDPSCVFEHSGGTLTFWYDADGIEWKKKRAGSFDQKRLIDEFSRRYADVKEVLHAEPALEREAFIAFVRRVDDLWTWFDCLWWAVEFADSHGGVPPELLSLRKETEYLAPGLIAIIRNTFRKLVPELDCYVDVLLVDEVVGNKIPPIDELERRLTSVAYAGGTLYSSLEVAAHALRVSCERVSIDRTVTELKGEIAYPGRATGSVHIVRNRGDVLSFRKGDVLVSFTTTPDFLPAMRKASAIISEHGGMISHAAISAREMKKSCVVGAKGAVDILANGDLVEVDAEKGVVRVIERAQAVVDMSKKMRAEVTRRYVPLLSDLFVSAYADPEDYQRMYGCHYYVRVGYFDGKYYYGPEAREFGEVMFEREKKEPGTLLHVFQGIYREGEALLRDSNVLGVFSYEKCSPEELIRTFKLFSNKYRSFALALLGFHLQYPIERAIRDLVADTANPEEAVALLTFPGKKNFAALEQENLLRIGEQLGSATSLKDVSDDILSQIKAHIQEYGWINTRGGVGDPWTPDEVLQRILEAGPNFAQKRMAQRNHETDMQERSLVLEKQIVGRDPQTATLIETAKELVYFRTYRTDYLNKIFYNARPLLEALACLRGVTFDDVLHVSVDELCAGTVPKTEIARRHQGYALFTVEENKTVFTSDPVEMKRIFDAYCVANTANTSEIVGNVAFSGSAQGIVRLLETKADVPKVQKGDIIVSPMTTPDMITALTQAAAFITDEGGITCHAAIVSRELKKPCIIGTKIATQVLKDGDMVEVDAEKGVVRRIL